MKKQEKTVSYFYDDESGNYMYNPSHPWRPHRTKLVHSLVTGYGLPNEMVVHRPRPRTFDELTQFHADGELTHRSHLCASKASTLAEQRVGELVLARMPPVRLLVSCRLHPVHEGCDTKQYPGVHAATQTLQHGGSRGIRLSSV
jgi:acetoin utilization deacetylase AcuC-like enzyme